MVPSLRPESFSVDVEPDVLTDLRARLRSTRWPDEIPGIGWEQGTNLAYLRDLIPYWADEFDWSAQQRWLNGFDHFTANVDGTRIHFVHQRAPDGGGIPLILTHGWPSSFAELLGLVPLLTEPAAHGIEGRLRDGATPLG